MVRHLGLVVPGKGLAYFRRRPNPAMIAPRPRGGFRFGGAFGRTGPVRRGTRIWRGRLRRRRRRVADGMSEVLLVVMVVAG